MILSRANRRSVASTITHGAEAASVRTSISSAASRNRSYRRCCARSSSVTCQAVSGSFDSLRNRAACSFRPMCSQNFTITAPSAARVSSNSTMS